MKTPIDDAGGQAMRAAAGRLTGLPSGSRMGLRRRAAWITARPRSALPTRTPVDELQQAVPLGGFGLWHIGLQWRQRVVKRGGLVTERPAARGWLQPRNAA